MVLLGMNEKFTVVIPWYANSVLKNDIQLFGNYLFNPCNRETLDDCPKRIFQIALDFCPGSRRGIRRIVIHVTDVATRKMEKKTCKVVNSFREIAL